MNKVPYSKFMRSVVGQFIFSYNPENRFLPPTIYQISTKPSTMTVSPVKCCDQSILDRSVSFHQRRWRVQRFSEKRRICTQTDSPSRTRSGYPYKSEFVNPLEVPTPTPPMTRCLGFKDMVVLQLAEDLQRTIYNYKWSVDTMNCNDYVIILFLVEQNLHRLMRHTRSWSRKEILHKRRIGTDLLYVIINYPILTESTNLYSS